MLLNARATSPVEKATFSLTWQVTHQAAVKFTNTGFPCACSAVTRSGDHGSDGMPSAGAWMAAAWPGAGRALA